MTDRYDVSYLVLLVLLRSVLLPLKAVLVAVCQWGWLDSPAARAAREPAPARDGPEMLGV